MNKKSILKSTLFLSFFIIFTKIIGLFKQVSISSYCGATYDTDAFYIATGVIGQIVSLIFSAIAVTALTRYNDKLNNENEKNAISFIKTLVVFLLPFLIFATLIVFLSSNIIAYFLAPKFNNNNLINLSHYIKIISLTFIPWGLLIIFNIILESEKKFIPGKSQLLFQNLFLIFSATFLYKYYGGFSLIYSFLLSCVMQFILIYCMIHRKLKKGKFDKNIIFEIKYMLYLSLPLIIGNAAYEINDIIDKQISSRIGEGVASLLTYSSTINEIITGVIVSSISTVLFVHFAELVSKKEIKAISITLEKALFYLFIILLPASILFLTSGEYVINILYGNGALQLDDLKTIKVLLNGYSVGFFFQAVRIIYIKVLCAFNDTKNTMKNGLFTIIINGFLSIILSKIYGPIGITLSTSISVFLSSIFLHVSLKKHIKELSYLNLKKDIVVIIISSIISAIVVLIFEKYVFLGNIINLIFDIFIFFTVYFVLLVLLKSKLIDDVKKIANNF